MKNTQEKKISKDEKNKNENIQNNKEKEELFQKKDVNCRFWAGMNG